MKPHHGYPCLIALSLLIVGTAVPAEAQEFERLSRFSVGGNFVISQPRGDLGDNISTGYGAQGTVLFHLLRSGLINLRFDFSDAVYGREEKFVPGSTSRVVFEVTTTNSIMAVTLGPEIAVPAGRFRPYANVGYSRLFLRTKSSLKGIDSSEEELTNTTNYEDSTNAWVYGGGVRIPLGNTESALLALDLGLRYYHGGTASYLREGSIQDYPDGSITITPLSSRTPILMYAVGVQFRIPR
ncbi:MAG TPA: outer membrane beta-barrel protein [Terriglobia bacterium]|nr:outer membrane beta-barrel protein [Terriglobia bacterium]